LATLTGSLSVVGDYVGTVRRSGVIIAMSSGLVASMALPAHAVNDAAPEAVGPATASIPMVPGSVAGEALFTAPEGGLLALPPDLALDTETIAAPAAATLNFEHSSFSVVTGSGAVATAPQNAAAAPVTRREARATATQFVDAPDTTVTTAIPASSGLGARALSVATRYLGVAYVWGGTSPRGFDCSGLTQYVYKQLGVSIGRTVADQRGDVRIIPRSQARPGDLVIFGSSHIGIYAGGNMMIDAGHTGLGVTKRAIYTSAVAFGRPVA
jgi:cell wall-associated NlpC family hydrolase